jgi:hypothetical protein
MKQIIKTILCTTVIGSLTVFPCMAKDSTPSDPTEQITKVGGITKIKHLYRDLVESIGGEFDYHDGYMKNRKHNLEARISRSDLIICPVNCNSHGACHKVKTLSKKYNKQVKMVPSSSLSSISNALFENDTNLN